MRQSLCADRQAAPFESAARPLQPSSIDPDDYELGPTGLARFLEDRIEELEAQKCEAATKADRRPINRQLHRCRDLLRWAKSRAGYEPDV